MVAALAVALLSTSCLYIHTEGCGSSQWQQPSTPAALEFVADNASTGGRLFVKLYSTGHLWVMDDRGSAFRYSKYCDILLPEETQSLISGWREFTAGIEQNRSNLPVDTFGVWIRDQRDRIERRLVVGYAHVRTASPRDQELVAKTFGLILEKFPHLASASWVQEPESVFSDTTGEDTP